MSKKDAPSWVPTPQRRPNKKPRKGSKDHQLRERVLSLMRKGATARKAIEEVGIHRSRLWELRKKDATFNARVAVLDRINRGLEPTDGRAMRERINDTVPQFAQGTHKRNKAAAERELVNLQQKEAFLRIYRETGSRTAAIDDPQVGVTATEAKAALEKDSEFRKKFDEEVLRRIWDVEDLAVERAKTSGVDARFLMKQRKEMFGGSDRPEAPKTTAPSWADEEKLQKTKNWIENGEVLSSGSAEGKRATPKQSQDD